MPGKAVRELAAWGVPWSRVRQGDRQVVINGQQVTITERAEAVSDAGDNLDDLFGDDNLPNVALIGTSFSRNSSFVGFLQRALSAPVGNFAKDGGEFSGAAKAYFDSPAFRQTPPQLVIWEIPERDLQTPYAGDVQLPPRP